MSESSKEKEKVVTASSVGENAAHRTTQVHEEKRAVVVIGSASTGTARNLVEKLEDEGFDVYGEEEVEEAFGKKIMIVDENSDLRRLMNTKILEGIEPKVVRPEKPKEPWRIKKGPFKGDFRRYR